MTTKISKCLEVGKLKGAEKLLKVELEKQNRVKFDKELIEEYEGLYPEYRIMTDEEYDEYTDSLGEEEEAILQEDTKVKIVYIDEDGTRTPTEYLTYQEWVVAKVQREETYEEYQQAGGDLGEDDFNDSEQYTKKLVYTNELVRPYTPLTQEELDASVAEYSPLQQAKIAKASSLYRAQAASITNGYDQYEIDSWITQEQEARAYKADNDAVVPMISAIAANRGIEIDDLADRIIAKADAFKVAVGTILGQKQAELG